MRILPVSFETSDDALVKVLKAKGFTSLAVCKNNRNWRKPIFLFKEGERIRKVVELYDEKNRVVEA